MALLLDDGGEVNFPTQMVKISSVPLLYASPAVCVFQASETVLHYCARSGSEDVLRTIVGKIGPGAVQIALNKQDKVCPRVMPFQLPRLKMPSLLVL